MLPLFYLSFSLFPISAFFRLGANKTPWWDEEPFKALAFRPGKPGTPPRRRPIQGRFPLGAQGRIPERPQADTPVAATTQQITQQDGMPVCLSFYEPLVEGLTPSDIVIYTGGDKIERRLSGYGKLSGDSIEAFANHHGYNMRFLDGLDYDRSLMHGGRPFHAAWSRVFAMPALRETFPDAKYIVWFDDDVLVPHPETHMLNHYVNMMEADPEWQMLFADEPSPNTLNSGIFIMRNNDFCHNVYEKVKDIAVNRPSCLRNQWEQDAIRDVRSRDKLQNQLRLITHRQGIYNFNNYGHQPGGFHPDVQARFGDAFVHGAGLPHNVRFNTFQNWINRVENWKNTLPKGAVLPVSPVKDDVKIEDPVIELDVAEVEAIVEELIAVEELADLAVNNGPAVKESHEIEDSLEVEDAAVAEEIAEAEKAEDAPMAEDFSMTVELNVSAVEEVRA